MLISMPQGVSKYLGVIQAIFLSMVDGRACGCHGLVTRSLADLVARQHAAASYLDRNWPVFQTLLLQKLHGSPPLGEISRDTLVG